MTNRNTTSTVIAGILLVLAMVLGLFVWSPTRNEVATMQTDLADAESKLADLQKDLDELQTLEETLPVNDKERAGILAAVPVGLNQDDLVTDLNEIATNANVNLNSMTFSLQNVEGATANIVSVVCNLTGNYEDLGRLLEAFENNDRLFKVVSIGVQLGDITAEGQQMTFSVSLEAYYQ